VLCGLCVSLNKNQRQAEDAVSNVPLLALAQATQDPSDLLSVQMAAHGECLLLTTVLYADKHRLWTIPSQRAFAPAHNNSGGQVHREACG